MRIFVYEFVTGGGFWSWPPQSVPGGSLLAEGEAMLAALSRDLRAVGHEVVTLRDSRLPRTPDHAQPQLVGDAADEMRLFRRQAASADATLVIAPETAGALAERARWADEAGATLWSPDAAWIEIAADKRRCLQRLRTAGVPTVSTWQPFSAPPWISKPADGCGSHDLQVLWCSSAAREHVERGRQVEQLGGGWPVSVAVLGGPAGPLALTPCEQHLAADFTYLGGRLPLADPRWSDRARHLALRAVDAIGPFTGYVGVDLLLAGDDQPAEKDMVVEVNPRLTTSYVGLSRHSHGQVAQAMIDVARGKPARWDSSVEVWFTASGDCQVRSAG